MNRKYFVKITGFIISAVMLLAIAPSAVEAAVECGWHCSGTTASCKAGGEETWIGYCDDGSTGTCQEFCQGSIDADVNCGGVIQHISCNTLWKDQTGCCRRDPPPTRAPTATPTATPTPTATITPTTTPTPTVTAVPTATPTPTAAATPTPLPACQQNASIALPAVSTPTPTAGPSNQAGKIRLALRFQGVEYDNIAKEESKKQKVKVSVIRQTSDPLQNVTLETIMSKSFGNVEVTAEKDPGSKIAVWKGEFTPAEVPAGNNYTILVKGPKHLQRKFCINNPTERVEQGFPYRCLGTGKINLSTSQNDLNFAGVLLQAGDLPVQDGIVNAYDVSRVLDILKTGESRKEEDLRVADMDLNGVVNAKDRSYLIETLEEKYGDEE